MKKILVATDFSEYAEYALAQPLQLRNKPELN
jgi:hypothetical protein